jgi:hypothetical protein
MARDSSGSHNEPVYLGTGGLATAADQNEIVGFAKTVGNARADTSTVRGGLAGADVWNGLQFYETDTDSWYVYSSGGSSGTAAGVRTRRRSATSPARRPSPLGTASPPGACT